MRKQLVHASLLTVALTTMTPAHAEQHSGISDVFFTPIATRDHPAAEETATANQNSLKTSSDGIATNEDAALDYEFYPVAGILGRDVLVPFFVDTDPGPGIRDYNCTAFTFTGHDGHDPYIRSFREMDIGVPVYAAQDGTVTEIRDGEEDHNVSNDPNTRANYVIIRHSPLQTSEYFHLRKGLLVKAGDVVTAGTQIGWVGSSGMSKGPHIHFGSLYDRVPYEPLAGPCRPGRSNFETQPAMTLDPVVIGAAMSSQNFSNFRAAPYDDGPRSGTFVRGPQRLFFKMEIASVPPNSGYSLTMVTPSGATFPAGSGRLAGYEVDLASFGFGFDVDLFAAGAWTLVMNITGREVLRLPFTVVNSPAEVVNRAPNPISPTLEPVGVRANNVAVCRVEGMDTADPDFDVVSYRYQWSVDGATVRDVTTAARSDALARQHVRAGTSLTCSVTASDGRSSTPTQSTHADVGQTSRRRATARR
jgi:hypothetical protein